MAEAVQQFSCTACGHKHTWKQELAGKRGRCKCGQLIDIPFQPESEPDDGTYDLAEMAADADRAAASMPPTIVEAPPPPPREKRSKPRLPKEDSPVRMFRRSDDDDNLIDKNRDVIAPAVLSLIGALLLLGFYELRFSLPAAALGRISLGLSISVAVESVILLVLGFIIAGPMGVSFGDVRSAGYKFAAIVIFADAVTTLADAAIAKFVPGLGGLLGFVVIGLPIAALVYWSTMTYLFDMDPGDSWLVVCVLAILYRITSVVLLVLIVAFFLSRIGIARPAAGLPSFGGGAPSDPMVDEMEHAKELGLLEEARQFIVKRNLLTDSVYVEGWYKAGAKNVWYQVGRDFNGHETPFRMVVELPADAAGRATCYQIARTYYGDRHMDYLKEVVHDTGATYLLIILPR